MKQFFIFYLQSVLIYTISEKVKIINKNNVQEWTMLVTINTTSILKF